MFHHILVTTDGSPLSNLALPVAADLARRYGATLTLLYAVPPPLTGVFAEGAAYRCDVLEERKRRLEDGRRLLDRARQEIDFPEAQLVCRETESRSHQVIADKVRRLGADLVVMGPQGRGGLAHSFLGSVAAVLHTVRVSVFLVCAPVETSQDSPARRQEALS